MGEVFLAEDTRLRRKVAIKRVRADSNDPQAHRRLLTEAQATARLDHPNICGIYEVGEDDRGSYIVMPFIEGETLAARLARGEVPLEESVLIAAQIGEALAAAHGAGILHRDIKPANVMVNERRQVRVMDFGLAKFTRPVAATDSAVETASVLTRFGSTLGTAAYMSPEQARGEPIDARSDLFSLGIVIHEMVTGSRPFEGASAADTIAAVLGADPPPLRRLRPDAPGELERIVSKLLRKDREERYPSAADLLVDLRAVLRPRRGVIVPSAVHPPAKRPTAPTPASRRAVMALLGVAGLVAAVASYALWSGRGGVALAPSSDAAPRIESLAVLPLTNVSADPGQEYFAAAMTEELTRALSGIKSLRVISRTSSAQFKDSKLTMPEIAGALNVDGLIEGSVVRDGDHVRITAQLIHGPSDRHLWADSYDGELRGMLALQRRVAQAIVQEVRATITPAEQQSLRAGRAVDPVAMDLYLKGRQLFYLGTSTPDGFAPEPLKEALASFTEALKRQPDWAEPHAGIATAQHWLATGGVEPDQRFPASRRAALEAIRLDDTVADGHGALAYVSFAYDWDLVRSEREFVRAMDLGPSNNYFMGHAKLLQALGRFDEARVSLDRAASRDPLSAVVRLEYAQTSLLSRDYDEAIRRAAALPASQTVARHLITGQALLWKGRPAEAIAELEQAGDGATLASALARAGRAAEARERLREFEGRARTGADFVALASTYVSLGEHQRAIDALERAFAAKAVWLPLINVNPSFDDLRGDPRFQDLLRRIGIPPRR